MRRRLSRGYLRMQLGVVHGRVCFLRERAAAPYEVTHRRVMSLCFDKMGMRCVLLRRMRDCEALR